jgi:hypothetical protein
MAKKKRIRSPRFSVPNNQQALISIGPAQFRGILQVLSLTGGTVRLQKGFPRGTFADIGIKTNAGAFSAAIELLYMAAENVQAFRFIAMGPTARNRLTKGLDKLRLEGFAVEKTILDRLRSFFRHARFPPSTR